MDFYRENATNPKLEIEGRDVAYGSDVTLKIARAGNKAYNRIFAKLYKQNAVALKAGGDASEAIAEGIYLEAEAQTILLGWTGPVKFDGKDFPYSTENAKKVLGIENFRKFVLEQAADFDGYKLHQAAEAEKN